MECSSYSCCSGNSPRSFLTKTEKIEMLKEYKKQLQDEAQGVNERIADLEKD